MRLHGQKAYNLACINLLRGSFSVPLSEDLISCWFRKRQKKRSGLTNYGVGEERVVEVSRKLAASRRSTSVVLVGSYDENLRLGLKSLLTKYIVVDRHRL